MYDSDDIGNFLDYLMKPQKKCYLEITRDYLAYFGNKKPSSNQMIVAKGLVIGYINSANTVV
jgi:hypothetical protein